MCENRSFLFTCNIRFLYILTEKQAEKKYLSILFFVRYFSLFLWAESYNLYQPHLNGKFIRQCVTSIVLLMIELYQFFPYINHKFELSLSSKPLYFLPIGLLSVLSWYSNPKSLRNWFLSVSVSCIYIITAFHFRN